MRCQAQEQAIATRSHHRQRTIYSQCESCKRAHRKCCNTWPGWWDTVLKIDNVSTPQLPRRSIITGDSSANFRSLSCRSPMELAISSFPATYRDRLHHELALTNAAAAVVLAVVSSIHWAGHRIVRRLHDLPVRCALERHACTTRLGRPATG